MLLIVHDLFPSLRDGTDVWVDDTVIMRGGRYLDPRLAYLNGAVE